MEVSPATRDRRLAGRRPAEESVAAVCGDWPMMVRLVSDWLTVLS